MAVTLMNLPYPTNALAPTISSETLQVHHGKHHKAYVDKTNALIGEGDLREAALEEIVRSAETSNPKLFNQAAQVWNHGFYWMSLTPTPTRPSADLAARISAGYGSLDGLHEAIATKATDHFGSGWAWLMADGNEGLSVETTHDAGCPVTDNTVPLLTIDVWEHAYYLDRKNDRKAYVEDVLAKLLNWDFASENLARGSVWTYPG